MSNNNSDITKNDISTCSGTTDLNVRQNKLVCFPLGRFFQDNLINAGDNWSLPVERTVPFGKAPALLENIRPDQKKLRRKNTLAYFTSPTVTKKKKSFVTRTPDRKSFF
jgi:hypothetical protein